MRVFISWSGPRSRYVAETLRGWLPKVVQSVRPWMSEEDISAGSRWSNDVSKELSQSNFGIICVTLENQSNPWLLFEAGALSKTLDASYVCPLLFDMSPSQLSGPLSQFQANQIDHNGLFKVLSTMNKALASSQLSADDLEEIFNVWWPGLEEKLSKAPTSMVGPHIKRTSEDLLEEVVENTREQLRRENLRIEYRQQQDTRLDELIKMLEPSIAALKQAHKIPEIISRIIGMRELSFSAEQNTSKLAFPFTDISEQNMENLLSKMKEMQSLDQRFAEDLLNKARPDDESHPV